MTRSRQPVGVTSLARDLLEGARQQPRPGFWEGWADVRQAQRAEDFTGSVARRSRSIVSIARDAQALVLMEAETALQADRIELERDEIAYARNVINLRNQRVDQTRFIEQATFGARLEAAMTNAKRLAAGEQIRFAATQHALHAVKQNGQLGAGNFDADDTDAGRVVDMPAYRQR